MPRSILLTLGLHTHSSWLAFPSESIHDLDNIRLSDVGADTDVESVFTLERITVEAHCSDMSNNGSPPRGLQLVLRSEDGDVADSSIVMANLGYIQLKANPGLYTLEIRRQGRGNEVFTLQSSADVAVTTFEGTVLLPEFVRKSGMEVVDLLDLGEGIASSTASLAAHLGSK